MTFLFVQKVGDALVPDSDESREILEKLAPGRSYRCEVKQPRNLQFHRLYFALCQRIGSGVGLTAENVSDLFKLATDHVTVIKTKAGMVKVPKSISFQAMDNTEFSAFFERCVAAAYEHWGIDPADVADLLAPEESQAR